MEVYHFYSINNGHPLNFKKITWDKDPLNIINNLFSFDSLKNSRWVLLLHPNGDYYINNRSSTDQKTYRDLLKNKNWEKHTNDFLKKYYALNPLKKHKS